MAEMEAAEEDESEDRQEAGGHHSQVVINTAVRIIDIQAMLMKRHYGGEGPQQHQQPQRQAQHELEHEHDEHEHDEHCAGPDCEHSAAGKNAKPEAAQSRSEAASPPKTIAGVARVLPLARRLLDDYQTRVNLALNTSSTKIGELHALEAAAVFLRFKVVPPSLADTHSPPETKAPLQVTAMTPAFFRHIFSDAAIEAGLTTPSDMYYVRIPVRVCVCICACVSECVCVPV